MYIWNPAFNGEWFGLDYESAVGAMPRWYAVSHGKGNDGVSHTYPDYYVRTCEPYRLAELAMVTQFTAGEGRAFATENLETDGEADYVVSCTILNPPDDGSDRDHSECESGEECDGCEECEPDSDYCGINGAWQIVEVFPINESDMGRETRYTSIQDCFGAGSALVPSE